MPFTTNWEPEGVYRRFTGEVSGIEILKSNFQLHKNPKFLKIKYVINDFTDLTEHSIQPTHIKVYADTDDIISSSRIPFSTGKLKIALVVHQEPFITMANSYRDQMKGKLFECEIFKTINDARNWVNAN